MSEAEVDARVRVRIASPLRFYDGATQRGMFGLPKFVREAIATETRIITKDNPIYAV